MTTAEFIEVSSEIGNFYGKELTEYEAKIWYEELKKLTKERFRQLARECFRNNKFMPKLADMVEYEKTIPKTIVANKEIEDCNYCNNNGIIVYHKKDEENEQIYCYGARCKCKNGMRLSKLIPSVEQINIMV